MLSLELDLYRAGWELCMGLDPYGAEWALCMGPGLCGAAWELSLGLDLCRAAWELCMGLGSNGAGWVLCMGPCRAGWELCMGHAQTVTVLYCSSCLVASVYLPLLAILQLLALLGYLEEQLQLLCLCVLRMSRGFYQGLMLNLVMLYAGSQILSWDVCCVIPAQNWFCSGDMCTQMQNLD